MKLKPPSPPTGGEWVSMGTACVDSGTLAVVDPCYVINRGQEIYGLELWDEHYAAKPYSSYCEKLGVQFLAGYGDGVYEVWGYVTDDKRIAQVTVCMIGEGEFSD